MQSITPLLSPPASPVLESKIAGPAVVSRQTRPSRKKRSKRPTPPPVIGSLTSQEIPDDFDGPHDPQDLHATFLHDLRALGALPPAIDPVCCHGVAYDQHAKAQVSRSKAKVWGSNDRLGDDHQACSLACCKVRRAMYMDKLSEGQLQTVRTRVHIDHSLVDHLLPAFEYELQLHIHHDEVTSASFVCARELVRCFMPKFFMSVGKLMHSIYTLNHPYGRGTPLEGTADPLLTEENVWRKWAGCPQAMLPLKSDLEDHRTRIWLLDGEAEVSFSAECEPDTTNVNPPINSSKGKRRQR